jgi:tetratricopeptide (TPR) repeat protein
MEEGIHIKRAQLLMEQGRYREAEKELLLAMAQDPNNAELFNDLSICRAEEGDFGQAAEFVQKAISMEPDNPHFLYSYSRILYLSDNNKEADKAIREAIALAPYYAEYFNLAGLLAFRDNRYQDALNMANAGLELEPENINCLNLRSQALVKLDRKHEAFETIQDALYFDPENAYTHANLGWSTLEKGKAKDALEHFRNALKLDPTNEWAKAGMVEAMKGRYWIYKLFLQYTFWMSKHGSRFQGAFIIGFYLLSRVAKAVYPPLIFLFLSISFLSWVLYPLSNLFLRINKYGRYALSEEDTFVSNMVGGSLLLCLVGVAAYFGIGADWTWGLAIFGFSMMIPLSSMLNPSKALNRKILVGYTILLGLVGFATVLLLTTGNQLAVTLGMAYLIGIFLYQWVANFLVAR